MMGPIKFCTACEASGNGRCIGQPLECQCLNGYTGLLCSILPSTTRADSRSTNDSDSLLIGMIVTVIFGILILALIITIVLLIVLKKRTKKTSVSTSKIKIITPPLYNISLSSSDSTVSSHIYEDLT